MITKIKNWIDRYGNRFFSSDNQLQRVIILSGILLVVLIASFAGYYYYDRYYRPQPKLLEVNITKAEQAVRDDPNNADKRLNLAETYMVYSRFDDALAQASQVMAMAPDNQHAWLLMGVANDLKGNPTDAIDPLSKYLAANENADMPGLNKSLQSAAFYLGDSYLKLNAPDKAVIVLEKAVEWSQTDADAMYKLGLAYNGVKRYADAVQMFQAATRFVPNYQECYEGLIVAYEGLNQTDFAQYARGMVAYSKKDYATALPLLLATEKTQPDFIPNLNGIAMIYEAQSKLTDARTYYEKVVQLNPNDFAAQTGLKRVVALLNK